MNKLKKKLASFFIPKNTPYCHYKFKKTKKYGYYAKPCIFLCEKYNKEWKCRAEYCRLIKDFLEIQDQVKDCGINEYEFEEN